MDFIKIASREMFCYNSYNVKGGLNYGNLS